MVHYLSQTILSFSRSSRIQSGLYRLVSHAHYLMGIGAGSDVTTSGEKSVIELLKSSTQLMGRPLCIFDVGANKGQYLTLLSQSLMGRQLQIHAFEPNRVAYQALYSRMSGNENMMLNNMALGRETGKADLFFDEEGSVLGSLAKRRLDHYRIRFQHSEQVQVETLDNYCLRRDISEIDLLKLDVEGFEYDVLRGGIRMFNERRVRMVAFEFGGANIDTPVFFQDFFYFFRKCGMSNIFKVTPSGYLYRISKYREQDEQFLTTNFLAIREE